MSFSIAQTLKRSALVGVGGVRPTALNTQRTNPLQTAPEHPVPQAKRALVNRKPDRSGLLAKVDIYA